jgi:two-component system sensor histidine kinase/response regulator
MKLLIADDELSTRIFLRHCATQWGYETVEASDGLEALARLSDPDPPRIAVVDWMMPSMDGVEFCSRLNTQEYSPLIYTILLTGRNEKEDIIHALDHGAHDFLSKPVHIGELQSRIAVGRRLVEAHDRLVDLDRLKDHFLRIAAHDLRNPLGYIMTMTEMLTDHSFVEVRQNMDQHLYSIHETASTMQNLISDLLDASAVWEGSFVIHCQHTALHEIVQEALTDQQRAAGDKKIALQPELAIVPLLRCDPKRIRQAVDRLLGNAIKHEPSGSTITLRVQKTEDAVEVAITDHGPELTSQELAAFANGSGATSSSRERSLSLLVVKKIIELHQGRLFAEKQAGSGNVFRFTLPIA